MGRIIVSSAVSADGYSHGAGGDLGVMPLDHAFNENNEQLVTAAARVLYGANFFRQSLGFWPAAVDDGDPVVRRIARRFADGMPMTVVSDTLVPEDAGPWRDQTTVVPRARAHDHVSGLRERDGDTVCFGGATLIADLLAAGLVDVLHLLVGPRIVAGDRPLLAGVPPTDLDLLEVGRFDGSPTVRLTYAVRSGSAVGGRV